ncbi:MAG: cadmium resistance transporter [Limosilactobacillus sp.]|uniref:cadmium resistance transporter n=1 Tax=Limosilactobacillus sp. TaxID=2773925 RepID=UPI00270BF044|nr:cadmium resistance transporter [Limosilactobacillus sp.]
MKFLLLLFTFIAVNLDFFLIMIFLLRKYRVRDVAVGYLIGVVFLMTISFLVGKALALFLPEWVLGALGILPIYMALHDDDDEAESHDHRSPILSTLITYLAVCAGCNLSIFLPVLTGLSLVNFGLAVLFIGVLAVLVVFLIKQVGSLPTVNSFLAKYGEITMKVIYIGVGLYVFYDSHLIVHLIGYL